MPDIFVARSKAGKDVRLTETVWQKVQRRHAEFSGKEEYAAEIRKSVAEPQYVVEGWTGEVFSLRMCPIAPGGPKYLRVVYREFERDGFVITAHFISPAKARKLLRRRILWQEM